MIGFKKTAMVALLAGLGFTGASQASLIDRGNGLIYDNILDITWLQDANYAQTSGYYWGNGRMELKTATTWADNLNYAGYTDWMLPTITQLVTQFRTNLGEEAGSSITASHNASYDLFTNIQNYVYWSSSRFVLIADPSYFVPYYFLTIDGYSDYNSRTDLQFYAWAVRPGDVAAVPVPTAFWLFSSGLIGLLSFTRRKSKTA